MKKTILKLVVYAAIALASVAGLVSNVVLLLSGNAGWTLGRGIAFAFAFLVLFAFSLHLAIVAALALRKPPER
ncbi:MAG: hypothetical protein WC509_02510 [Candidatus Izemoplasmatales bacterium]